MKRFSPLHLAFLITMVLLAAACAPLGRTEPTTRPTIERETLTAVPDTPAPTDTLAPPVSTTPTTISLITPTATAIASEPTGAPTSLPPTATSVPPTATPVPPTATPVPPTSTPLPPQTAQPTRTQVPPTATFTSTPTPLPPVVITDWRAEFFANSSLQGPARVIRNDLSVDVSLSGGAAPVSGVPGQNWSARWTRNWTFEEGNYRFNLLVDDGARLWVGGKLLIDSWIDGPARTFTGDLYLKGQVPIQLDYYNHLGDARVRLNWERVAHFDGWKGSYYANTDLSGLPLFQRDDLTISFNWGSGSPRVDLPADGFSVRWSRTLEFAETGQYRFAVDSDDGARLWIDDTLVIDGWKDGHTSREVWRELSAGKHNIQLDYYEHWGDALIQLSWGRAPATPTPTSTSLPPTSTSTPTPTATLPPTATPTKPPVSTPPRTATPSPIGPQIALEPEAGSIGEPFEVVGSQWPANSQVELFLVRPVPDPGEGELVATAIANEGGRFAIELEIPAGEGWEGCASATIEAKARDVAEVARTTYLLLPELRDIPFNRIPTEEEERYRLTEPTYLVLDSEEAWTEWFGEKPPQVKPPVNWKTDIVLGAFLGQQARDIKVGVDAVVQRGATVSVWLTVAVPEEGMRDLATAAAPRVMIRISRNNLRKVGGDKPTDLVFAFLDANGRLLAQGPAGGALPRTPPREPGRMERSSEEPAAEPAAATQDEGEATAEAVALSEAGPPPSESSSQAEKAVSLEAGQEAAQAESELGAPVEQPAEEVPAVGRSNTWFYVGGGIALLVGGALVLWFSLEVVRRRRQP